MNQSHTELAAQARRILEFVEQDATDLLDETNLAEFLRLVAAALESPERVLINGLTEDETAATASVVGLSTSPTAPAQDARQADEALMRQAAEALDAAKFVLDAAIGMHLVRVPEDADGPVVQIPEAITALRARLETSNV